MESAKSDRLKERLKIDYTEKDREVKRSAREDKRKWTEEKAEAAEKAAENGRSKELYTITKMLTGGKRRQTVGVKDKQGVLRTEKSDRTERWKEHFSEILNIDAPIHPITEDQIEYIEEIEDIDTGRWRISEVISTLKRTRSGKATGVDQVGPELLKSDMETTASRLLEVYNKIWESETWPKTWKQGLIVKIFKKGDMRDCNNWRGVTLLPVISKVFSRMIIDRIKKGRYR